MNQPIRRPLVVAIAAAKSTQTSTSHSVDPTGKGAKPGGGNNFSPTAVAPLTPPPVPARVAPIPAREHGRFRSAVHKVLTQSRKGCQYLHRDLDAGSRGPVACG